MPLDTKKKDNRGGGKAPAIGKNIAAEMHAGKPQKQAEAIAFATQRRAMGMADGGVVPHLDAAKDQRAGNAVRTIPAGPGAVPPPGSPRVLHDDGQVTTWIDAKGHTQRTASSVARKLGIVATPMAAGASAGAIVPGAGDGAVISPAGRFFGNSELSPLAEGADAGAIVPANDPTDQPFQPMVGGVGSPSFSMPKPTTDLAARPQTEYLHSFPNPMNSPEDQEALAAMQASQITGRAPVVPAKYSSVPSPVGVSAAPVTTSDPGSQPPAVGGAIPKSVMIDPSAWQPRTAAGSGAGGAGIPGFDAAVNATKAGIAATGEAQSVKAAQLGDVAYDTDKAATDLASHFQQEYGTNAAQRAALVTDIANSKTPSAAAFWQNKSTGQKVMAGIAIALGGVGQALMHSNSNAGLDAINTGIERSIQDQQMALSHKQDTLKNLQASGVDIESYFNNQRAALYQAAAVKTQAIASAADSDIAKANAQQLTGDLLMKASEAKNTERDRQQQMSIEMMRSQMRPGAQQINEGLGIVDRLAQNYGAELDPNTGLYRATGHGLAAVNPVAGVVMPWVRGSNAQKYQSDVQGATMALTKRVGPDAVQLSKTMFPSNGDSPDVAINKLNQLRQNVGAGAFVKGLDAPTAAGGGGGGGGG